MKRVGTKVGARDSMEDSMMRVVTRLALILVQRLRRLVDTMTRPQVAVILGTIRNLIAHVKNGTDMCYNSRPTRYRLEYSC